jgi:hypothetical protein
MSSYWLNIYQTTLNLGACAPANLLRAGCQIAERVFCLSAARSMFKMDGVFVLVVALESGLRERPPFINGQDAAKSLAL